MALYHFSTKVLSRSTRNTVGAVAYRAGCKLEDVRTGETFDYQNKDVAHVELLIPKNAPQWIRDIQNFITEDRQSGVQKLTEIVEAAEGRIDAQVWREIEIALHRELTNEQNIALAREFVEDQLYGRGMAALLNFHFDKDEDTGELKPHCHILLTMRTLEEKGFSFKKERSWNAKALMCDLREQWAHYSNFHLKLSGYDITLDHRSYHERGIEIEPQPKQGKGILEQERRCLDTSRISHSPVTDKAKAFYDVQLRNLYRIMRRPELVLEIATKHHITFMWADVQKILHRYIDEVPLFHKMEARLRKSQDLVLLRSGKEGDIYTTRNMLKAEASLVEMAETLGKSKFHEIDKTQIEREMIKAYQGLGIVVGLSLVQERAIQHLVSPGQLSCVVGIAGSGKTTILGVCHEVWKAEGYAVYGLAPTGKAAQNLEQSGIRSTTIHKFLKDIEAGRAHYTSKSILVLDEAGMVDVERFSKLLSTVKQLGVKLVVVGDGAQLQPVEAGPAFRLITERVGKADLMTVVRQKEDWQKEATVLFGTQRTKEAIERYQDKGCVHIVEENPPSLQEVIEHKDWKGLINLYEVSNRVSSLIYRERARDVEKSANLSLIRDHQDFGRYLEWKDLEKDSAKHILQESTACKPILESRFLDPTKMALLFVDKSQELTQQQQEAREMLKECGLESLVGLEKSKGHVPIEVRQETSTALINAWHTSYQHSPDKFSLMLAFSNKDVEALNSKARFLLKTSGHLDKQEFLYTTKKETDDDFGKKHVLKKEKGFSKGDRIVFTRNNYGLGVKNGTMGTITALTPHKIQVKLDQEQAKGKGTEEKPEATKETIVSFVPNLNPYFDHGWAITIHKSQGTTVDKTYVLASSEMNQNLTYVAMTRHREDVQVFGSSLDFWREEKLPEMLSKSGEKLVAADYLDATSFEELMYKEESFLTKIIERISDELDAMGAVSKRAFLNVADHFLGRDRDSKGRDPDMRVNSELFSKGALREETRAESLRLDAKSLQQEETSIRQERSFGTEKTSQSHLFTGSQKEDGIPSHSFDELKAFCEDRLRKVMEKEGNELNSEKRQRFAKQAEKTATYLMHSHVLKIRTPTEQEITHASLRAKYELKRIPQIREEIIKGWQEGNNFKESEHILAHSVAERRASIEGRLFLHAKQQGLKPPSNIEALAQREFKEHRVQTNSLAYKLAYTHSSSENVLSSEAAQHCAKDIFRYMEMHGEKPSESQISAMMQIAKTLEHRDYGQLYHSNNPHEIDFFRRHEGESLLRQISDPENIHEFRDEVSHYLNHIDKVALPHDLHDGHDLYSLTKSVLKAPEPDISHEIEHDHDEGFSL